MIDERGLYEDPRGFVFEVLSEGWRMLSEPPISLTEWLRREYVRREPDSQFARAVREGLFALLSDPAQTATAQNGDEALAQALDCIRSLHMTQATDLLRDLVHRSVLRPTIGDYTDLHGRAMTALVAIDGVDPWQLWESERAYPEYAPMAFALVRERVPERVPEILADAARLGFLRVATRSIAAEYGIAQAEDRGFRLLREGAARVRDVHDPVIAAEFQLAVAELALDPGLQLRIVRELDPRVGEICVVTVCGGTLGEQVAECLISSGVHVVDAFWRVAGRPIVLLMNFETLDVYEGSTLDLRLGRPDAAVAVLAENTPVSFPLHPRLRVVAVPPNDHETAAKLLSRAVFRVILSLAELIPNRRGPQLDSLTRATSARRPQILSALQRFRTGK